RPAARRSRPLDLCPRSSRRLAQRTPSSKVSAAPTTEPSISADRTPYQVHDAAITSDAASTVMTSPGNGGKTYSITAEPASASQPRRLSSCPTHVVSVSTIGMVRPPALRPGDLIGVCAPAGPVNRERFANGLAMLGK